jgi:hypothetical protein
MTHARFVVVANERSTRVYRLTSRWASGHLHTSLVERAHHSRGGDESDDGPYANAIVDTMLRAFGDAHAPSVVVSTSPRIQRCLRKRMHRVVLAGASGCEIGRDLTTLDPVELQDKLIHEELL